MLPLVKIMITKQNCTVFAVPFLPVQTAALNDLISMGGKKTMTNNCASVCVIGLGTGIVGLADSAIGGTPRTRLGPAGRWQSETPTATTYYNVKCFLKQNKKNRAWVGSHERVLQNCHRNYEH